MADCKCWPVDDPWTYYGIGADPLEPNPDCPEHFPTTESEEK